MVDCGIKDMKRQECSYCHKALKRLAFYCEECGTPNVPLKRLGFGLVLVGFVVAWCIILAIWTHYSAN